MLRSFRLERMKAFKDTGWIELAPLTILIGANSSGKSCLLQALLMLKQTWESRDRQAPLIIDGRYAQLGSYEELAHRHEGTHSVVIHLDMKAEDIFYSHSRVMVGKSIKPIQFKTRSEFAWASQRNAVYLKSYSLYENPDDPIFSVTATPAQPPLTFESNLFKERTKGSPKHIAHASEMLEQLRFYYCLHPWRASRRPTNLKIMEILSHVTRNVEMAFYETFGKLYYLGPVREAPHRWYHAASEMPPDVGLRGEGTGQVLFHAQGMRDQVKKWLNKLGIAPQTTVKQFGPSRRHYAIHLTDPISRLRVNVADTGFGVSQVLPVVVETLHAPSHSLILIEQPEIHLHPRLQAELADFLLEVSKDKNLIVETHSEHILLRLQRRIAEGGIEPDRVAVYYVAPGREGSSIRKLEIDRLGRFVDWPNGFFEEDLEEAFQLAKAQALRHDAAREKSSHPTRRKPTKSSSKRGGVR